MELYKRIKKILKNLATDYDLKEEIREIFSKVKKDFPYIPQEIEIKYDPLFEAGFCIGPGCSYLDKSPASFENETIVVNMFFKYYTRKEKEAIIAHELGHYGQPSNNDSLHNQIEADKRAAEVGYGKILLNMLNKFKNRSRPKIIGIRIIDLERELEQLENEIIETRIRSLEQKLGQLANGEGIRKPEST